MPNDIGRALFGLAAAWIPADQPLYLVIDDTLARKGGKGVALASMHHDPLLSTARNPFSSLGHVWVVLALWVPLPMGGPRGFALPLLLRLYIGAKRGSQRDAPSRATTGVRLRAAQAAHPPASQRPTTLELARELIGLVATWAGDPTLYGVVDSAYAGQELPRDRPPTVHIISRLRLDAALRTRPRRRCPGQIGRPRKLGKRVTAPQVLVAAARHALWADGHAPRLHADRPPVRHPSRTRATSPRAARGSTRKPWSGPPWHRVSRTISCVPALLVGGGRWQRSCLITVAAISSGTPTMSRVEGERDRWRGLGDVGCRYLIRPQVAVLSSGRTRAGCGGGVTRVIARKLRSAMRRHAEGADLSKLLHVPGWLDALLSHDLVAFPLHVLIGDVLNRLDAPPALTGLEWLKAAAHASSDGALRCVANGLTATRRRAPSEHFDSELGAAIVRRVSCHGRDVTMQRRQMLVLERAGIRARAPAAMPGLVDHVCDCPDGPNA